MFGGIFRRRVELDRRLVQGKLSTLLYIFLFVLCIPLVIYVALVILDSLGLFKPSYLMSNGVADDPTLWWAVLYHFIDPGNQTMAAAGSGRVFALLLALLGSLFMNGFLVSSIVGWYDNFVNEWKCGQARYDEVLKRKRFVVIVGAHESVPSIIRQSLKRHKSLDYVVVQTNKNVEEIRGRLVSYLTAEEEKKVILYAGDRTSKEDVEDLHLNPDHAVEVFIMGDSLEGSDYENNHDALNLNCLQLIAAQLREAESGQGTRKKSVEGGRKRLVCRVMFEYQTSFSIFQYSDISNDIRDIIDFKPMNFYELWAQRVLVNTNLSLEQRESSSYLPLEGVLPICKDSEDAVHLVIVGMSRMGVALAIEAARLAHYPNFVCHPQCKTRITFIDKRCHTEMKYFQGRFKELFELSQWRELAENEDISKLCGDEGWNNRNRFTPGYYLGKDFIDVEWEFVNRGIEDDDVHRYLQRMACDVHKRFTVAICLPNDNKSVAASLYLPEEVYERAVQVLVYQYHNSSVIDSISIHNRMNRYYKQLKAFGMIKDAYNDQLMRTQEYAAYILSCEYDKMYKDVVKRNCIKEVRVDATRGKSRISKYWSNVYNANSIWTKLRSVGYDGTEMVMDEEDVRVLAVTEHNRWVIEQLLMRFRCLTPDEQEQARQVLEYKEELKGCKMAHLDICAYDRLKDVDPDVICFDEGFIRILPQIIKSIHKQEKQYA